jgi:8-oxo-dGTP pyrophosphatase MutT (NUDIX family)
MLKVVSAAIVAPVLNRVLLAQRSGSAPSYPLLWCTPGGKVKPMERQDEALARELKEEIGGDVEPWTVLDPVYRHAMTPSRTGEPVEVICYRIDWYGHLDAFSCLDATIGIGWFDSAGLYALRDARMLTPADEANIDALAALVRP